MEQFYVGLHQPSDAQHFSHCCIHVGRLATRQKPLGCEALLLDSQAFRILELHGEHQLTPAEYAALAWRIAGLCGRVVVVPQDYMCEAYIFAKRLEKIGVRFTVADHQRLTIARYDALHYHARGLDVMPVLQGYAPAEYVAHIEQYGRRLAMGAWVGVGSVCKRNGDIDKIAEVLLAIKQARPDLRLHGFGLKKTALESALIESLLHSADSMAWSMNARKNGRSANSWREAEHYTAQLAAQPLRPHAYQHRMAI
jgi:hypothetical protein